MPGDPTPTTCPHHTTNPKNPSTDPDLFLDDPSQIVTRIEAYDRWIVTAQSPDRQSQTDWSAWVLDLPARIKPMGFPSDLLVRIQKLHDLHLIYQQLPDALSIAQGWKTDAIKAHRWAQIESKLLDHQINQVILIGNGKHTRDLLDSGWPAAPITVISILDEHSSTPQPAIIPIITPPQLAGLADCHDLTRCVMLPSSDAYEEQLINNAHPYAAASGIPIWRVYTDPHAEHLSHDQIARTLKASPHSPTIFAPLDQDEIDPAPAHRLDLGLAQSRSWSESIASTLKFPNWATGHINTRDTCFIWDLIETIGSTANNPITILEIGTASGVSTATLALGASHLCQAPAHIHAFDILEYCYFDASRKVGDAIHELAGGLIDTITLHPHTNARDATSSFEPGSVDLVLIDADHRHPAPAIDLLTILPILKPSAWVIIHDIELDRIQSNTPQSPASQSGPEQLYDAWDFGKIREQCDDLRESNIGALKIPSNPFDAQQLLLDLIR